MGNINQPLSKLNSSLSLLKYPCFQAVALCERAALYISMQVAINDFREACLLDPLSTQAHLTLGEALEGNGDYRDACESMQSKVTQVLIELFFYQN